MNHIMGLLSDLITLSFIKRRAKRKGCGIGDMVMLKTGGPIMMVVDVDFEEVECEWFSEKDHSKHRECFMFEMLVNVNNFLPQSGVFKQHQATQSNDFKKKLKNNKQSLCNPKPTPNY
ncbi:MAG: DUF2158 domain-containing protein [Bacteroidales bacterium]|nr:DUF2158 domain-containing protein [Bacteroidales bacterium]